MNLETKKILMNDCSAKDLDSVGSNIKKDLKECPQLVNEPPETASEAEEMTEGVHLYDIDDEWYNSLSSDDLTDFFEFIESTNHLIASAYNEWKTNIWSKWEEVNNCYMNLETI